MSGHSKWSTIKRQKGAADAKRGVAFGKLTNAVILAAKHGGGDPEANFELKMAVEKAKANNMPKENIERAIKKGTGELGGAAFEEVLYEAIAQDGVGILIEAATDNRNRTAAEIKNVLTKAGAKQASPGAVSYQFDRMGKILVDKIGRDIEEMELAIIESGAEDFDDQEDSMAIYTKPNELEKVKKNLEGQALTIKEAVLSWEPKSLVKVENQENAEKLLKMMETLEELDDVSNIYSNFDISLTNDEFNQ